MTWTLIAALGGVVAAAGAVLGVAAVIGTNRPPRPPSAVVLWLARVCRGEERSRADQRRHQGLLIAAGIGGALGWLVTGMPVVGLLVAVAIPGAPWLFHVGAAERRSITRIEAVGEWARRLKDLSSTGQGLQQAIVAAAATAPPAITDEAQALAAGLQAGTSPRTALLAFADALADPVADQIVAALILHLTDRGQRLGEVLASIAAAAAAEVGTRREVEAKRSQPRFAVRFLTGMTLAVLGYGLARPLYMRPYATTGGQLVMFALGGVFVALLVWVRSMSQPPRVPRFLDASEATR